MTPAVKFLIGLAAVVAMGWVHHGPLGNGEAFVRKIEAEAQAAVARTEVPVQVRLQRGPLSRVAILSGQADEFQREGQGKLKGINDLVRETEGVADIRWADAPVRSQAEAR
jgi:hypothetical protein